MYPVPILTNVEIFVRKSQSIPFVYLFYWGSKIELFRTLQRTTGGCRSFSTDFLQIIILHKELRIADSWNGQVLGSELEGILHYSVCCLTRSSNNAHRNLFVDFSLSSELRKSFRRSRAVLERPDISGPSHLTSSSTPSQKCRVIKPAHSSRHSDLNCHTHLIKRPPRRSNASVSCTVPPDN